MSDTTTTPRAARPWHLSDALLPGAPVDLDTVDDEASGPQETPDDGDITGEPLTPLWYRIVTGQSFIWRIRAARNRLRWKRRHLARGVLRWLELHPEVRTAARHGQLTRFAVHAISQRRRPPAPAQAREFLPPVDVAADVDIADSLQDLVDDVELTTSAGPGVDIRKHVDERGVITVTSPAGTLDLLRPFDLNTATPQRFTDEPQRGPGRISEMVEGTDEYTRRKRVEYGHRRTFVWCGTDSHEDPVGTARSIVEFAAAGVPMAGELSSRTAHLVGAELHQIISGADPAALRDPGTRRRQSARLRRAALAEHTARGTWRRIGVELGVEVVAAPSVSVLLPSNRPADVIDAARRIDEQRDVDVQLVVGLHGSHMSNDLDDQLAAVTDRELVVVHLADELNLGQVLSAMTEHVDGRLVSKWDDDDWYDPYHLADLCWAMEQSGANLIGKAAEFVYLEQLDLTIQRFSGGGDRFSTTIAGGTLLLSAEDMASVGWADAPRRVDRLLIDGIEDRGGTVYRANGFGYILRRRGADLGQHTWAAGDEYFLSQGVEQRAGLDLEFAGFGDVGDVGGAAS